MSSNMDPWGNYFFALELKGVEVAHFTECSGLKSTAEVFEIQEGGLNGQVHRMVGRSKWDNIVLKYATSVSTALLEWRDRYLQDQFGERTSTDGSIVMYANSGKELRRYNFVGAWPVSWEGPQFNAGSSVLAIETLEIAHEGIYIDGKPPKPPEDPEDPEEPEDPDTVVIDEDDDQIHTENVQFGYDSDELTPEGEAVCDDVGEALENHPEITTVWVEGHASSEGSWGYNLSLTQARAQSVKEALEARTTNKQYITNGYSWKYPIASNKYSPAKNRRVEFYTSSPETRGRSTTRPPRKPD